MPRLDRGLARIEFVSDTLAAAAMAATAILVAADVVARYILRSPLSWSQDVLTLYLVPAMFFLGLPGAYSRNAHIAVDILIRQLSSSLRIVAAVLGRIAALLLFTPLLYFGIEVLLQSYAEGEMVPGSIPLPVWPSYLLVPIGCVLTLLRVSERLSSDATRLFDDVVPPRCRRPALHDR